MNIIQYIASSFKEPKMDVYNPKNTTSNNIDTRSELLDFQMTMDTNKKVRHDGGALIDKLVQNRILEKSIIKEIKNERRKYIKRTRRIH